MSAVPSGAFTVPVSSPPHVVDLTMNATALPVGNYNGEITILHNATNQASPIVWPITLAVAYGWTPVGTNVTATVSDDINVTFGEVTASGTTTVDVGTVGPPPPDGFAIIPLAQPTYFDIQTTAVYDPPVTVCLEYDPAWLYGPESDLTLWHWDTGLAAWVDVTTSLDMVNNIICGEVNSLSPFALMQPAAACSCPCHGDPQCDGIPNIQDVVQTVNVAFRGSAPVFDPQCPKERTDVNCDDVTTVQDVVKVVNVAFRGANPATEFCDPCAP
ncbi:MAG: hypothetical protein AB1792_11220 [Candidatus Zixiibacteriota bacterium]